VDGFDHTASEFNAYDNLRVSSYFHQFQHYTLRPFFVRGTFLVQTVCIVIGVARILSGVHFFLPKNKKSWRPFFSRRPQRQSKYASKSNPTSKNCPKNRLLLWLGGALRVLRGALTHFPCKLRLKFFFTALGVQVQPLHPWLRLCA